MNLVLVDNPSSGPQAKCDACLRFKSGKTWEELVKDQPDKKQALEGIFPFLPEKDLARVRDYNIAIEAAKQCGAPLPCDGLTVKDAESFTGAVQSRKELYTRFPNCLAFAYALAGEKTSKANPNAKEYEWKDYFLAFRELGATLQEVDKQKFEKIIDDWKVQQQQIDPINVGTDGGNKAQPKDKSPAQQPKRDVQEVPVKEHKSEA